MEYWGPLIQTALWVGLIGCIAVRFHKPIQILLEALTERIKSGSDVSAGPFSLRSMQSLSVSEQIAQVNEEIEEASTAANLQTPVVHAENSQSTPTSLEVPAPTPKRRAEHFQAEDLALRAVQAEFGQPISRQVRGERGLSFDGAFVLNNRMNIVDVKYTAEPPPKAMLQLALDRVNYYSCTQLHKSVTFILVVVVDRISDTEETLKRLIEVADESLIPTVVRVYALRELQARFGIAEAG